MATTSARTSTWETTHQGRRAKRYIAAIFSPAPANPHITTATRRLPDSRPVAGEDLDEEARARRRKHLRWFVPPLILLVIGGYTGQALFPTLVDSNPTLLILLNPRNANLALVSNDLDALTFYGAASFRLLLSDPIWFFIGREYGDAAIHWLERQSPSYGRMARQLEGWFGKAAYLLVVLAPNNWICLLSGAARMRPVVFISLNLIGTFGRLYLIRVLGDVFSDPLESVRGFISDYQAPLLVVSFSLVGFTMWNERRKGGGELDSLAHLDEELEADD